jgi:hypothetical protein
MDLSFYPLTLDAFDALSAESLCLFVASDERPLTGLAGLADWRLSGRLSRMLRAGLLTGAEGEALLTQPGPRLAFKKLFLFGVGPTDQSEEKLTATVLEALRKIEQAGVHESATHLPSRLSADAGIRTLIDQLPGPGKTMLFGPDPQKLVAALSREAVRAQPVRPTRSITPPQLPRFVPAAPARQIPIPPNVSSITATPADGEEKRPAPPPPQRYVPVEPKQNVFDRKRKK